MKPTDVPGVPPVPEMKLVPLPPRVEPPEVLPLARAVPEAIPSVLPIERAEFIEEVLPPVPEPPRKKPRPDSALAGLRATGGWLWRWLAGATLCFTGVPVLTYFTAVVVVGWTYRWMQAVVLRGWWRLSPVCKEQSFQEFCASFGPDGPTPRPRWFFRERIQAALDRPGPGGKPASPLRLIGRALAIPVHSLWRNFSLGVQALVCDAFLLGWGCLFMLMGWEFGWLNSFHKGYEQSGFGAGAFIFGGLLLTAAMFYVPMAQAHQAATGQARAFFEFRFVWKLVRSRLGAYVGLALLIGFASLVFSILRATAANENLLANHESFSAEEGLANFRAILWWTSLLLLFPLLLLLRLVAAVIYRSAVLKVLRRGRVSREDLHPVLRAWLDRLRLDTIPTAAPVGIGWWARLTARWAVHRILFTVLFFVWMVFFLRHLAQYFFVADPITGFLNHPMIELPCFDLIPQHLYEGRNE